MKIAVCIKQVPAFSEVMMDPVKGILLREGTSVRINPYDLTAVEAALQLKERYNGLTTAITMGPKSAKEALITCLSMGVDEGVLLTDPIFAGADVYATSYTLTAGLSRSGPFDIIICGKKTTDGDTGQVGPAIAEHLGIPHVYNVTHLDGVEGRFISLTQMIDSQYLTIKVRMPCVLVISKEAFIPRLPSLKLKLAAKKKEIRIMTVDDLEGANLSKLGMEGSPTHVDRIYTPDRSLKEQVLTGHSDELVDRLIGLLKDHKVI